MHNHFTNTKKQPSGTIFPIYSRIYCILISKVLVVMAIVIIVGVVVIVLLLLFLSFILFSHFTYFAWSSAIDSKFAVCTRFVVFLSRHSENNHSKVGNNKTDSYHTAKSYFLLFTCVSCYNLQAVHSESGRVLFGSRSGHTVAHENPKLKKSWSHHCQSAILKNEQIHTRVTRKTAQTYRLNELCSNNSFERCVFV